MGEIRIQGQRDDLDHVTTPEVERTDKTDLSMILVSPDIGMSGDKHSILALTRERLA